MSEEEVKNPYVGMFNKKYQTDMVYYQKERFRRNNNYHTCWN